MTARTLLVAGCLAAAVAAPPAPASAQDTSVRLRLGLYTPRGDSEYWDEKAIDFTGDADDFEDVTGGLDVVFGLNPHLGVAVSVDHFEGSTRQEYRDWLDASGFPIMHRTTLEVTPLTAGVQFRLAPPRAPIVPYLGVGGGLYLYRLEERGEFIDFGAGNEIFAELFETEGETFGYYFVGGLEVPIGRWAAIVAEARWDRAEDELEEDFAGLGDLDLSGRRITGGVAWRF